MTFSRWVFRIAGTVGIVAILPQYFVEERLGRDFPPAVTHPEFFYGFAGVALAWQVAFLIIGQAPTRYRPLMIPAMLEKFTFSGAVLALYLLARVSPFMLPFAAFDGLLGLLFVAAWWNTPTCAPQVAKASRE